VWVKDPGMKKGTPEGEKKEPDRRGDQSFLKTRIGKIETKIPQKQKKNGGGSVGRINHHRVPGSLE